jgi:two-component system, OmpR family, phosphate regulon sensor histidine kinase PhoR
MTSNGARFDRDVDRGACVVISVDDRIGDEEQSRWAPRRANDFPAVLLAMAGHDLRQPLQVLAASFGWLGRRLNSDSEREYVRRGQLAVAQMTEQLDHLVDALRLHEHSARFDLVPVRLEPLLVGICRDHLMSARAKGVELRACRTHATVMSDAILLESILRNLVRNALKYTRPGGRVLLGCRRRGPHIGIEVLDTGVGIPHDKLSRIFEAFHRLDWTRSDGLGLGLFVVRCAADLLGHEIEVRSLVGHGSCFGVLTRACSDEVGTGSPPRTCAA